MVLFERPFLGGVERWGTGTNDGARGFGAERVFGRAACFVVDGAMLDFSFVDEIGCFVLSVVDFAGPFDVELMLSTGCTTGGAATGAGSCEVLATNCDSSDFQSHTSTRTVSAKSTDTATRTTVDPFGSSVELRAESGKMDCENRD